MFCISRLTFLCFVSIDICTIATKIMRNMHAVSTNQTVDILHFDGNKGKYHYKVIHKKTKLVCYNVDARIMFKVNSKDNTTKPIVQCSIV